MWKEACECDEPLANRIESRKLLLTEPRLAAPALRVMHFFSIKMMRCHSPLLVIKVLLGTFSFSGLSVWDW